MTPTIEFAYLLTIDEQLLYERCNYNNKELNKLFLFWIRLNEIKYVL